MLGPVETVRSAVPEGADPGRDGLPERASIPSRLLHDWADRLDALQNSPQNSGAEPSEEACRAADTVLADILADDDMPCLDDYRRILRAAYAVDKSQGDN